MSQQNNATVSDPLKVYQQATQVKSEQENRTNGLEDLADKATPAKLVLSELENISEVADSPKMAQQPSLRAFGLDYGAQKKQIGLTMDKPINFTITTSHKEPAQKDN